MNKFTHARAEEIKYHEDGEALANVFFGCAFALGPGALFNGKQRFVDIIHYKEI